MGRIIDSTAERLRRLDKSYEVPIGERMVKLHKTFDPVTDKEKQTGGRQESKGDTAGGHPAPAKVTIDQRVLSVVIGQANVELTKQLGRNPTAVEIRNAISTSIVGLSSNDVDKILRNTAKGQDSNTASAATGKSISLPAWIPGVDDMPMLQKAIENMLPKSANHSKLLSSPLFYSPTKNTIPLDKAKDGTEETEVESEPGEDETAGDAGGGEPEIEDDDSSDGDEDNDTGEEGAEEEEEGNKSLSEQMNSLEKAQFKFKKKGSEIAEGIGRAISVLQTEIKEIQQASTQAIGGPIQESPVGVNKVESDYDSQPNKIKRKEEEIERLARVANNLKPDITYELDEYQLQEYKL